MMEQQPIEQPWFIRPKDAEQLTGLDESTIRLAINKGDLLARRFRGRGWLIDREDLHRWILSNSTPNIELTEDSDNPHTPIKESTFRTVEVRPMPTPGMRASDV